MVTTLKSRRTAGRRAWRHVCAAAVMTMLGVVAASGAANAQVASPAPDRLWGGCQLTFNSITNSGGTIDFDFLVLYSLLSNDGQPFYTPPSGDNPASIDFTGPIVCTAPNVSIQSYSEAVNIPNTLPPGPSLGNSIDIRPSVLGTAVRYSEGSDYATRYKKQLCHQILDKTECHVVEEQASVGCTIPMSQYDDLVEAIANAIELPDPSPEPIRFSVAAFYKLDSSDPPRLCKTSIPAIGSFPAIGHGLTGPVEDQSLSGTNLQVLDAENISALNYEINGGARNGKAETRLCHSVADKTDCFRIFKP